MKILLINPIIRGSKKPFYFPLGIAYIAQMLLNTGNEVEVLDINAHRFTQEETIEKIRASTFDIVCLTGLVTEYLQVKWLARQIRKFHPDTKIVLGGGLATIAPELVLEKSDIDIVVLGEGEETMKELINTIKTGKPLSNIDGIWFKEKESIQRNKQRVPIEKLDDIPFPARDLFPIEQYLENPYLRLFDKSLRTTQIITSRGCPYNCIYCFKGMWGQRFRKRSADNIIDEIIMLKEKFNIKGIQIVDDLFVMDNKRVHEFCDKIIKQEIDITWVANGRVNVMDMPLLRKMKSAGCRVICYGIESGNQKILDSLNKGVTVGQAEKVIQETWQAGILPHGYLMMGMFDETKKTIKETVDFCNRNGLIGQFSFVTPIPNTELFELAKKRGKIPYSDEWVMENWGEWNDRILINLTEMQDFELISLKREAERDILIGNIFKKLLLHIKVINMKNIVFEGFIKAKEWYLKDYAKRKQDVY